MAASFALVVGSGPTHAGDTPVIVMAQDEVRALDVARIEREVAKHRPLRQVLALPAHATTTIDAEAQKHREDAIALALSRARQREGEAAFGDCVRDAASVMSEATEVLAETSKLALLYDLHLQIGACMVLDDNPASARPHFDAALLLQEQLPPTGLHREEVELALADAFAAIQQRSRGKVLIRTQPDGATIWMDGRELPGKTPLTVEARLGDHYLTARRFRFEPHTVRVVLQPSGQVDLPLEPASRITLRDQLAALGPGHRPPFEEMRLARARWSRAEELLDVSGRKAGGLRLELTEAELGESVRAVTLATPDDDDALRDAVCRVLGEACVEESSGPPWYLWPIVGGAAVAGAITIGLLVVADRDVAFCPPSGC